MKQVVDLAEKENVEIAAVCDVWNKNLAAAAAAVEKAFGSKPVQTSRFGDLVARDDVDAVIIATPDFGHTPILIEALQVGQGCVCRKTDGPGNRSGEQGARPGPFGRACRPGRHPAPQRRQVPGGPHSGCRRRAWAYQPDRRGQQL